MKKITAIVNPAKYDAIKKKLIETGVSAITVTNAEGFAFQKSRLNALKDTEMKDLAIDPAPKIKIEIICAQVEVEKIIAAIMDSARTGRISDGKIFISPVEEAIRIRTGERGEDAV